MPPSVFYLPLSGQSLPKLLPSYRFYSHFWCSDPHLCSIAQLNTPHPLPSAPGCNLCPGGPPTHKLQERSRTVHHLPFGPNHLPAGYADHSGLGVRLSGRQLSATADAGADGSGCGGLPPKLWQNDQPGHNAQHRPCPDPSPQTAPDASNPTLSGGAHGRRLQQHGYYLPRESRGEVRPEGTDDGSFQRNINSAQRSGRNLVQQVSAGGVRALRGNPTITAHLNAAHHWQGCVRIGRPEGLC